MIFSIGSRNHISCQVILIGFLGIRDFHSLDELRGNLQAYVSGYNRSVHSSLNGKSPQDRFFSEPECIHRLSDEEIDNCFLLEIECRVSSDCVVMIDHVEYEVDCQFARQRIKLRYSPDLKNIFIVEADGTLTPIRLLNKHENAFVKRKKIQLYEVMNNGLLYTLWSGIQSIYKEFQRNTG